MTRSTSFRFLTPVFSVICLLAVLLVHPGVSALAVDSPLEAVAKPGTVRVTLDIGSYDIQNTKSGSKISLEKFGHLNVPGKPQLPSRIVPVAIPPGARVTGVRAVTGEGIELSGAFRIPPAPLPRVITGEDPALFSRDTRLYDANYQSVYMSAQPFPRAVAEFVRHAGYRKYNLADIRVMPFVYHPQSGKVVYHPEVTLHVSYDFPEGPVEPIMDNLESTERQAREFIVNYDQAQVYYPPANRNMQSMPSYVVITTTSLVNSIDALTYWESFKGRRVRVVTTNAIDYYYSGIDLEQKIRNFLRDKYPSSKWGITDVLLVGHWDDVPMRRTAQTIGYGLPRTDFYYAELSRPDNESWDFDGDRRYGEDMDPVDFYNEINVGRIPLSNLASVRRACQKSVDFEQSRDVTFKRNILLLGAYFWETTDTAVLMEYISRTDLHPWFNTWTNTKMYEQNAECNSPYSCDYPLNSASVLSNWPNGKYAFVSYAGHGSPWASHIMGEGAPAFIGSWDCPALGDDYPSIVFADACSNSDTNEDNIGWAMLKNGAVGFLGSTEEAYGSWEWADPSDGSSQTLNYYFTTFVTSGKYTQGEAHQRAMRNMYLNEYWYNVRYETFEWGAFFGNPTLRLMTLGSAVKAVGP